MVTKEQLKKLREYSFGMDSFCREMEQQLIEVVKSHGNLIKTDNADNRCVTLHAYVEDEDYRMVEKKILAVTTHEEEHGDCLCVLVDEVNVAFAGDETDEEILGYDDWYWVFDDVILPAPTLWDLCDFLSDYIDDVQE